MSRILIALAVFILCWFGWRAYRRYIIKITTSGYIPTPSPTFIKIARLLCRFWTWVQIGKVKVVNPEYLNTPGRVVYCAAPHGSMMDGVVTFPVMPRPIRTMGAYEVMRNYLGIPAIVVTKMGAFPVDRKNGKTVLGPATDLLVDGQCIFLCPEGKIEPSGEMMPFKPGASYIGLGAYKRLGGKERVAFVPIHICFHKRHPASAYNYFRMGFRWRGGLTITACKPIWIHEQDNLDPEHLTQLIRQALIDVQCVSNCGSKTA